MAPNESVAAAPVAPTPSARAAGGLLAAVGVVTGLGAIMASSCCVVPLTLAFFGAGAGIFATLEAFVPWRMPLLVASGVGVAFGWFAWWQRRRVACESGSACATRPPSRASLALLLLATLIVATAIGWDYLEPSLLKLVRSA
jgi:mercuric ion transport protein